MCGRFLNTLPPEEIARLFQTRNPVPNYPPRYNIAPTQPVLVVRFNRETRECSLDPLRWGLVPHWSKDLSVGYTLINARREGIAEKPSFRDAFAKRRCLIPASGFYEWHKTDGAKTPYAIVPTDAPLFAFAGLWENWRDKEGNGEWVRSCTIITGPANERLSAIHPRMPVILDRATWAKWLGEEAAEQEELLAFLQPYPATRMRAYPISTRVNNVRNDDQGLIEPMMAEGGVAV